MASNLPAPRNTQMSGGSKEAVKKYLAKNTTLLSGLLPSGMDERRIARIAMQCFSEIPSLASCSSASIIGGILASAQVGLPLGKGAGGYAYLIPFSGEAQLVIGIPGRIALAYRSGFVNVARCGIVYSDQHFEADPTTGTFKIGMKDPEKDYTKEKGQWFWAAVEMTNGGPLSEYRNRPTAESIRKKLQSKNSPAWRDHFDEMALNGVLRYTLKRTPQSSEQQQAEAFDSRVIRPGEGSLVAEWVEGDNGGETVIEVQPNAEPATIKTSTKIEAAMMEAGVFTTDGKKEATKLLRASGGVAPQGNWYDCVAPWDKVEKTLAPLLSKK